MKLLFERSHPGIPAPHLPALPPEWPAPAQVLPAALLRTAPLGLPEVAEPEVVRHFTTLSRRNIGVDTTFYPLGSCTMKYNPKVNEWAAALPGFARLHPAAPAACAQGALRLLHDLEGALAEVAGMAAFTLAPLAGASGELTGMLLVRAFHAATGGTARTRVLVPDSAHGTNPASAALAGYQVVPVPSTAAGEVDVAALRRLAGPDVAAMMLTNPNTLGVFERRIGDIRRIAAEHGFLLYYDGANLNAIVGKVRPGDMGFDVVHFNLHKTFSTPHGGGGPGAGPVGVTARLAEFLPGPRIDRQADGAFAFAPTGARSIGRVAGWFGNFGVLLRAYAYLRAHGAIGLRENAEAAVLNANYLRVRLAKSFPAAQDRLCMHEFVAQPSAELLARGVRTMDVAKALIDHGIHPPTVYFPLIVREAMMVEPTETESKDTLDHFIAVMEAIAERAVREPEWARNAPHTACVSRVDEVRATRQADVHYQPGVTPPDVP